MVDLGPIQEDVPFAWGAAAKLRQEFLRAAEELEGQVPSRNSYAQHALQDWRGRYAQEFEGEHMAITTGDARRIAAELRKCAQMLHELANLARKEQERRDVARAWQVKHDAWEREQSNDGFGENLWDSIAGDDEPKPPEVPEIKPEALVAASPPVKDRG